MSTPVDRTKSLQQLEGKDWGEPTYDSHLVRTCHRLRRQPLSEFTPEDLRIMIGQGIGLDFLVPLAVEVLAAEPLASGDFYCGDLLAVVVRVEPTFWRRHAKEFKAVRAILARLRDGLGELAEADRETVQRILLRDAPAFSAVDDHP
jgi:hypothetical protein